jgi:glycosyltransferase involved in cell wall biosynthesis
VTVSVIIPTYNGAHKIPGLLEALLKQSVSNFELVIVLDGSSDNTLQVLESFKHRFSYIKVVEQENRGRSIVRNRGAKEASGTLLIFYDDDMVPFPNSVGYHIHFHETYAGLCTGNQREQSDEKKSDIHNYKASLSEKWLRPYPMGFTKLTINNLFFTAANCSLKRDDFNKLGGFDESLTDAEDFDLAYRALQMGLPVYFDKSNDAGHEEHYTLEKLIARQTQYAAAHVKLKEKHAFLQKPHKTQPFFKQTLLSLFRSNFCMFFLRSDLFKLLPKRIRYKLYDWVIFAHSMAVHTK